MKDLVRLLPILKLLEDKCAARIAVSIRDRKNLESQLQQIKQYRMEYEGVKSDVPVLLANAKSFVRRVDKSIDETEQRVLDKNEEIKKEAEYYNLAKARYRIVEMLIKKQERMIEKNKSNSETEWQIHCKDAGDGDTPHG